ncbi:MAG: chemotaxis response regulator protein-glutamate methylesterase [Actinomycetota bacterium]
MTDTKKTRVLVVDDSALVRKVLVEILESDPDIEVAGVANDPFVARDRIKQLNPDVLTLDVEMPRMDGVTFLSNLMRLRPMPVVMVSSLTEPGAAVTLAALELGAIDFITKPKLDVAEGLEAYGAELIQKVKVAAKARPRAAKPKTEPSISDVAANASVMSKIAATDKLLAIGASTGGTEAIREVLSTMPPDGPPTVIAQHIPAAFSGPFAERLDESSPMQVKEAVDGEQLVNGHAYVAPGSHHLRVRRSGARYMAHLSDDAKVNGHRPSVDVLFESVATVAGINAVGVLLTGMGCDGAVGLKQLLDAGAPTMAQDEATSVVWGMPGEAVRLGAAADVLPIGRITERILTVLAEKVGA